MRQQLIDHVRTNGSPLASAERRALIHMAQRLPGWVTPDHLSGLGLAAMAGAGLSFWAAQYLDGRPGRRRPVPGPELVRRQPRRHAGPRAQAGAAALRLLRRPRHRPRRRDHAVLRPRRVGLHVAARRARRPLRLPARLRRGLPRHPRAGRVQDDLPRRRPDRAPHPSRRRRRRARLAPDDLALRPGTVPAVRRRRRRGHRRHGRGLHRLVHPQHARALRRRASLANRGRGAGRPRRQRGRRVGRDAVQGDRRRVQPLRRRHPRADPGGARAGRCCRCPADRRPRPCGRWWPRRTACRSTCPTRS